MNIAQALASMGLGIYVINLADCHERLENTTASLCGAGLEFSRFDAVDARNRQTTDFPEYDDQMARRRYGRPLFSGEIGCFLSHKGCVDLFLKSEQRFALIVEDDLSVSEEFGDFLLQVVRWLDQSYCGSWDVVNLGNSPKKHFTKVKHFNLRNERLDLCAAHYFPLGTFALLWNRAGAISFEERSRTIYAPIDQFLRDWCSATGRGLAFDPSPVNHLDSKGQIARSLLERIKTNNLMLYWIRKNVRLIKNQIRARRSLASSIKRENEGPNRQNVITSVEC
jgi:glycosyl transferase, family 25